MLFGLSMICTVLFGVAYFVFESATTRHLRRARRLQRRPGLDARPRAAVHRHRDHPVGPQADGRPRDRRVRHRRPPPRRPRRDRRDPGQGLEESGLGRRPLIRNTLLGAWGARLPPSSVCVTSARCPATSSTTRSGGRHARRARRDRPADHVSDLQIGDLINAQPEAMSPPRRTAVPSSKGWSSRSARPRPR